MPTAQKVVGALIHGDGNKRPQRIDPGVSGFTWIGVDICVSKEGKTVKTASRAV